MAGQKIKTCAILALILLATVIAYGNSFRVPFIYDDTNQIVENALVKNPSLIPRLFTPEFYKLSPKRFRPVTVLFYVLQYAFWRLNPWGYHLFKLLLHLVNIILLYAYLRLLRTGTPVALGAAALFALHPAHVETVTCISFLDDPLMFFWFFLSLIAATRATRVNRRPWTWTFFSLFFYLLSLASKELALVLPLWIFLQLLTERFPGISRRARFWLGFIAVSLVWVAIRFFILEKEGWLMISAAREMGPVNVVSATYLHYLRVALIPVNLCLDYVYPLPHGVFSLPANSILLLALAAGMLILGCAARSRLLFLGWGWFIVALLPIANIISQPRLVADRYLYLPLTGFCLVFSFLFDRLRNGCKSRLGRLIVGACFLLVLISFGVLVHSENRTWADPRLLWEDILRTSPASVAARNNLGSIYLSEGKPAAAESMFRDALDREPPEKYRAVILTNLALSRWEQGEAENAVGLLVRGAAADPDYAPAAYELGKIYLSQRKYTEAQGAFRRALGLAPYNYIVHDYLAGFYASRGNWDEAERYARQAVHLNPDSAISYDHLGVIYANQGKGEDARHAWRQALELDPSLESARRNQAAAE